MKNKLLTFFMLLALIIVFASCSSQRYGCPGNPQASTRFRGWFHTLLNTCCSL